MYIRWVTRRHKSALSNEMVFHDAYLVESYRDEGGRPRQRTVGYLGNLRRIDGEIPHIESELFMLRANQRLRSMALHEDIDHATVAMSLRQQLPSLTPDAARHAFASQIHWFYEWWSQHGTSAPEDEIMRMMGDLMGAFRERGSQP